MESKELQKEDVREDKEGVAFSEYHWQNNHRKNIIKICTLIHIMKIVFLPDQIFMFLLVYWNCHLAAEGLIVLYPLELR